jgi:polyisoprenoid-binding protein YceI
MVTQEAEVGTLTRWEMDPSHSLVEFSAKHMMFTTVKGQFGAVHGTILADEENPSTSSVEVEIDAASIDSRVEQRDAHLRSADFLDVENFPRITFKSTRVEPLGDDRLRIVGDLTIRGVTREVTLEGTDNGRGVTPYGQQIASFTLQTTINRKDFGLNWNVALEAGGVLVSDKVQVLIETEVIKQDPAA